jgi:hypothetical protein
MQAAISIAGSPVPMRPTCQEHATAITAPPARPHQG